MDTQKIEIINNWNLSKVFDELESGNMKIPRFQRDYVWQRAKIVKLLNSINKQYPIGSFFLWDTTDRMDGFCKDDKLGFPEQPQKGIYSFILDGQQRITSLYVALKGKVLDGTDYATICYNLDKQEFKIPNLKTEPNNIPAWKIFDNSESMKLVIDYASHNFQNYANSIMKCKENLYNYPVSIIKSKNVSLEDVVDIFERINQGGKRLSLFDLVHASVWSTNFDLKQRIEDFTSELNKKNFGSLAGEVYTQSLALNTKGSATKSAQLQLKNHDCLDFWDSTLEAIRKAIDFIIGIGIPHTSILPYQAIVPVVQYFFFNGGNADPIRKQKIQDWIWSVTFSLHYSASTLTRMKDDADWIKTLVSDDSISRTFKVNLNIDDLRKIDMQHASVIKNGILCILANNNPLDFDNGQKVYLFDTNFSRTNSKENHHFFPYSLRDKLGAGKNDINSVLNFAFISKRLNLNISNKYPSKYLLEYENSNVNILTDLKTHFINKTAFEACKRDDFDAFIKERGEALLKKIYELCPQPTEVANDSSDIIDDEGEILQ